MKVYHGSYTEINTIDFSLCSTGKDFGKGFYVTKLYEQAKTWAERKGERKGNSGFVTEFEYSENFGNIVKLKMLRFDDYTDEWLDFVVLNRKNETDRNAHDYDIVEGPVADDKIATDVDRYLEGSLSREQFMRELTHHPSHQICFCTMQSLQALSQPKGKIDIAIYDIGAHVVKSLILDYDINEMEALDRYYTSKTYGQIADESTLFYQKPWQEIYEMLTAELKDV